jgi:hypothetical protein
MARISSKSQSWFENDDHRNVSHTNPYEVTRAPLVDPKPSIARRPVFVTTALVLLWLLLAFKALGSITQVRALANSSDPVSVGYFAYLAGLVFVPAFLLMKIAHAADWARIALLIVYVLNLLFRIFLFVNNGIFTLSLAAWLIVPASIELIALALLFLPRSSHWFRGAT